MASKKPTSVLFITIALVSTALMLPVQGQVSQTTKGIPIPLSEHTNSISSERPMASPIGPWDRDNWTRYRNLNDTMNELMTLASRFSSITRLYNLSDMFPHGDGSPRFTHRNRTIWGLKISDSPGINETDEPEVFYCAMTHAREWISNEVMLYFINYVLRNYGYNDTVDDIVNSTELWFIPVVNPDGFQESIDKDDFNNSYGLAGWRKNVNETNGVPGFQNYGSGQGDGADPNRNFGYQWMGSGSSGNPDSLVYRGSSPFSEPETQIIRELAMTRNFTLGISFHSFSGLNLYPWGHTTSQAKDRNLMDAIARKMSTFNGYTAIQASSLYQTNGDFMDYFYGSLGIPAFTIELNDRDSKFIPEISRIEEDCKENLQVNFLIAELADDPYRIFEAGINGTVQDPIGSFLSNAHVNISGAGRTVNLTTGPKGHFQVYLEPATYDIEIGAPGGLTLETTTEVRRNTMEEVTYTATEKVPPVVSSVKVNGDRLTSVEWGINATITVKELHNEKNLTGKVKITPSTGGGRTTLTLQETEEGYKTQWNTRNSDAGSTYELEAVLTDPYGNSDLNGSDPSGPDLTIDIVDTTPPEIYGFNASGTRNLEGSFEWGTDIRFELLIEGGGSYEKPMDPDLIITDGNNRTTITEIPWVPVTDLYAVEMDTAELGLGNHTCQVEVSDEFGNRRGSENITVWIRDTQAPGFQLTVLETQNDPFTAGEQLHFKLTPDMPGEEGLVPEILIIDPDNDTIRILNESEWSQGGFLFDLDTEGFQTGTYHAEGRLYDHVGNHLEDGFDLVFDMIDLTPPEVGSASLENFSLYRGQEVRIIDRALLSVSPVVYERDLSCSLRLSENSEQTHLEMEENNGSFTLLLDRHITGFGVFEGEILLEDRWGNPDPDGLGPGPDLILNMTRSMVREIYSRGTNLDLDEPLRTNGDNWVLQGEDLLLELGISNLTDEDVVKLSIGGETLQVSNRTHDKNGSFYLWKVVSTDDIPEGPHSLQWSISVNGSDDVTTDPFFISLVSRPEGIVTDIRMTGMVEEETNLVVDLEWETPPGVSWIMVMISQNGTEDITVELPGSSEGHTFTIQWADAEFLIIAGYQVFPYSSGRNGTHWLYSADNSSFSFKAPKNDDEPKDGDGPDNVERSDGPDIRFIAGIVIVLALLGVLLIAILKREDINIEE